MKKKLFFLPLLFLTLFSCSDEDDGCSDRIINTTSLEHEYGCTNTKYDLDLDLNSAFIRDQASFDSIVTGNCHPDIDFSTFDLVIGKRRLISGNDAIEYELTENCETGNLVFKVFSQQNESAEAIDIIYHRLIPKMAPGKELTVSHGD